jgi:signal transduction histidine kinase
MEDDLLRSNAELQQFAAVASHDLAEPLATMGGFAHLLRRRHAEALGPDGLEMLDRIASAAERMRRLIDDMLALAQAGAEPAPSVPVPLRAVLDDVRAALGASIERTGAEIEIADLPTVAGDRGQLTRLFQNLLANALKFTAPERAPEVEVAAHPEGEDWCVEVADRGFGIAPEDAERAFEAFRRLHSETRAGGTGLGLAICRRIARAHGGDIQARPRDGGGTVFAVLLPAAPQSAG